MALTRSRSSNSSSQTTENVTKKAPVKRGRLAAANKKETTKPTSPEPVAERKRKVVARGRGRVATKKTVQETEPITNEPEAVPDVDFDDDLDDEPKALVIEEKPVAKRGRKSPHAKATKQQQQQAPVVSEAPTEEEPEDAPKPKRKRKAVSKKVTEVPVAVESTEKTKKEEPKRATRGRKLKSAVTKSVTEHNKTAESNTEANVEQTENELESESQAISSQVTSSQTTSTSQSKSTKEDSIEKGKKETKAKTAKAAKGKQPKGRSKTKKIQPEPEPESENELEPEKEPLDDQEQQEVEADMAQAEIEDQPSKEKELETESVEKKKESDEQLEEPTSTQKNQTEKSSEVEKKSEDVVAEEEEPETMDCDEKLITGATSNIQKVVYDTKVSGKDVIKKGTIPFEWTANNSLYLITDKEVGTNVEKLKITTKQTDVNEDNKQAQASEDKQEEQVVENPAQTSADSDDFDPITTTFDTTTNLSFSNDNVLNSTMDNFTRKRKADEETEDLTKESKRRAISVGGKVLVFGDDIAGELGLGEIGANKSRPFPLPLELLISEVYSLSQHNAILSKDGRLFTFGCNDECALGRITTEAEDPEESEATPIEVDLKVKVVLASTGDSHTAVLTNEKQVFYWGAFRDSNGVIGLSDTVRKPSTVPIQVPGQFIEISSGANFLLLLGQDGVIYSLGNGERGELGRLTAEECKFDKNNRERYFRPAAVKFDENVTIERVWAGEYTSFARSTDGRLFAWGLNNYSQLGFAPPSQNQDDLCVHRPKEVKFFSASNIVVEKVSGGQHHTLVLDTNGRLYTFGRSDYGRLGHGKATGEALEPKLVEALKDKKVTDIACSTCASFAVTDDGELYSWGMASSILGLGEEEDVLTPTKVKAKHLVNKKVIRVTAGSQHCLIIAVNAD